MKLLAPRMSKLWLFWEEMYTQNRKEHHFMCLYVASSRQLVLSDGLMIDPIRNGISQRILCW